MALPDTGILHECNDAHLNVLTTDKETPSKQAARSDNFPRRPTTPATEISEPTSDSSERDNLVNDKLSKHVQHTVLKRMEQFDTSSTLPKNGLRQVAKLTWDDFDITELLGCGGFATVVRVSIHRESSNECHSTSHSHASHCQGDFAIKFLHPKLWYQHADRLSNAAADLAMEAKILSRLNHENIIQLHAVTDGCPSTSFHDGRGFFLVLGLLEETLHSRLRRWRNDKHDNLLDRLESTAVGIARGMEYLHENNIAIRDLKTRNIGYDKATGKVKLFDLGLACEIPPGETQTSTVGTFRYLAPEVVLGYGYDLSCDVYSFGIVLWQICSLELKFAYKCNSRSDILEWVAKRGGRPSLKKLACPRRINRLIKECWHPDPQIRPSFKAISKRLEKIVANPGENTCVDPAASVIPKEICIKDSEC